MTTPRFAGAQSTTPATASRPPLTVRIVENGLIDNPLIAYRRELLTLAIRAAGREPVLSDCSLPGVPLSERRMIREVAEGKRCDLMTTSSGGDASAALVPVPVPIYLGGGGYRVLLVNEDGLRRADAIVDLAELRTLRIGSGSVWADTTVWERNGYAVEKADYGPLFTMLAAGRFDAMPRSAFEILGEHERLDRDVYFIERRFLFHVPNDLFFYVGPHNSAMRDTLALGLHRLYCSGEFERFLRSHASTRDAFSRLLTGQRKTVEFTAQWDTPIETRALGDYPPPWVQTGPRAATCQRATPR
ncbi:hypothetical protein ACWA7J_04990 [Leptothrix sp. BB-4]